MQRRFEVFEAVAEVVEVHLSGPKIKLFIALAANHISVNNEFVFLDGRLFLFVRF